MLKKLKRKVLRLVTKKHKKRPKPQDPPSPSPPLAPATPPTMAPSSSTSTSPFLFPNTQSTVLPDPSRFFSPNLLSSPLPTNSFFQNLVLKNGDQPEYIHPYIIKSSQSSLTLCYPSRFTTSAFIYQVFIADLTISSSNTNNGGEGDHVVSSFSDLSVTLDIPQNLRFYLVRGSPFLSCSVSNNSPVLISTIHGVLSVSANGCQTKHTVKLNNNQTWVIYSSTPLNLSHTPSSSTLVCNGFSGIIRFAALPNGDARSETILDLFSACYPVSGDAVFTKPFSLEYKWEKKGWGELLMLAHPLHLKLLSGCRGVTVLEEFKYKSMDGDLVGVVGDSWVLQTSPVSVTWHSNGGVKEESFPEIVSALSKDVDDLKVNPITTSSSYFYGKLIARAARFVLIAEEVSYLDVIPTIKRFLKDSIEPWLDGSFNGNGFLFDPKWGGIVSKQGSLDSGADFGFGLYNDHHYHLGYFLYGIAVLAKIDTAWGRKYKPQAYSLMADFMNFGKKSNSNYPRLRNFDLWKLHSWAGGLTEFADGRNQESTSEAVNGYYSAALMGLSYGDTHLVALGSALTAMEIQSAQTWWHVKNDGMYDAEFSKDNKVVGVLWSTKRDSGLWFAPPEWKECRLGIQLLPLLPISEDLFSDVGFTRELVEWTLPVLKREGVGEGWKGFVYALEGLYDKQGALQKIRSLTGYDDGNSLSNLLWWIHSRG